MISQRRMDHRGGEWVEIIQVSGVHIVRHAVFVVLFCFTCFIFSLLPLFWKKKWKRLMRSTGSLCIPPTPPQLLNGWTNLCERWYLYHAVLHKSFPSVCVSVCLSHHRCWVTARLKTLPRRRMHMQQWKKCSIHRFLRGPCPMISSQNYWVIGLCPSSSILETRKQRFGNWICFRPQVRV
jgi:hypothetical protein